MAALDRSMGVSQSRGRKDHVLHARFSLSEVAEIVAAAKEANVTVSGFVRSLTIEGAGVRPFLTDDDRRIFQLLISEMRSVGVNLNQLARAVNSGRSIETVELESDLRQIQRLLAAVILESRTLAARGARKHRVPS